MKELLEIGKIVNTHGVRGDLKVEYWCDTPELLLEIDDFILKDNHTLSVEEAKIHKNHVLMHFEGIDTMEDAEKLKNQVLYVPKEDFDLPEGVYFIKDLIGIPVTDVDSGFLYGRISEVLQGGGKDVYVIKSEEREYLVPAIEECIIEVSLTERHMKIRPLRGLFD